MTHSAERSKRNAVTRLELLVLVTALGGLALSAFDGAEVTRGQGQLLTCQAHLRQIGQLSVILANADSRMIAHRQSSSGSSAWNGLGAWDWGGADGQCGEYRTGWPLLPDRAFGAETRPYNHALFGDTIPPNADFSVFGCPSDVGAAQSLIYEPYYSDPAPCTSDEAEIVHTSMYQAFGTSFQGDFIWFPGNLGNDSTGLRYGSFMRPYELVTNPSELLLFAESRFMQAYISTKEFVAEGALGGDPTSVASWHEPDGFNLLLIDGHVINAPISVSGSLIPLDSFPINDYQYRSVMARGSGWRVDSFPEAFVVERRQGNPLVQPLSQGLMLPLPASAGSSSGR